MASDAKSAPAGVQVAPENRTAIGISFGNSNSSIAYTFDDRVEVIANEDGDRQIPTVLSYVDGEEYYGQQAKNFLVRNSENTVAYFKDLLGKDFAAIDPTYCHASAHPQETDGTVTFSIVDQAAPATSGESDEDSDETSTPAAPSVVPVSEVATRFLRRLVGSASDYLGRKVTSAVITLPTNTSEAQRQAVVQAANAAGLEVLQTISEPAAAAAAYHARIDAEAATGIVAADAATAKDKFMVVLDVGGTRSDAAVVSSSAGITTVLAALHDYEFVGAALDRVLIDHFAKDFAKRNKGVDPRENPRSLAKMRLEAESAKKALSLGSNASFSVESLADGIDFTSTINRFRYETLARPVFAGIDRLVGAVVRKAGLDPIDIDAVLLSGGTAHTPRLAENMRALFAGTAAIVAPSTVASTTNPSELQARGAALQASLICDFESDEVEQSSHQMVRTVQHTALAVGVVAVPLAATAAADGTAVTDVFTPIIAAESAVPIRRAVLVPGPPEGGDVLLRFAEGSTHVHHIPKEKKATAASDDDDDDDSDDDSDDDADEGERKKAWKAQDLLAEAALRGVGKNAKIEVAISIRADFSVSFTAREVGGKAAIRGSF